MATGDRTEADESVLKRTGGKEVWLNTQNLNYEISQLLFSVIR